MVGGRRFRSLVACVLAAGTVGGGALGALGGGSGAAAASPAAHVARVEGAAPIAPGSTDLGRARASATLHIDVSLRPRDPGALGAFLHDLYTKDAPGYHRFLGKGAFGPRFGAAPSTISAVDAWLTSRGIQPGATNPDDLIIPATTSVGVAEHAFSTSIRRYRLATGHTGVANVEPVGVPSSIARVITSVVGLTTTNRMRPAHVAHRRVHALSRGRGHTLHAVDTGNGRRAPGVLGPVACSAASDLASSTGGYRASQLAKAYGFTTGAYAHTDLGAGETIALFEAASYDASTAAAFEACYGIDTPVVRHTVTGGPTTTAATSTAAEEVSLDIDTVAQMAPDASIEVYDAPNTAVGNTNEHAAIANADTAGVVSSSWSLCEYFETTETTTPAQALHDVAATEDSFEQMAAQGQSMLNDSNDTGSEDCYTRGAKTGIADRLAVAYPTSSPYVTGVGGTDLTDPTSTPPQETVWNDSPHFGSSGGGISSLFPMPAYQKPLAVDATSSGTPCDAGPGGYCREVPDVSASGDPTHGYPVYFNGKWTQQGGTSAATPLWAALVAEADERCGAGRRAGLLNPALYAHPSDLNDITTGTNSFTQHTVGGSQVKYFPGTYSAQVGYDMASGLGTPTAALFTPGVLCTAPPRAPVQSAPTAVGNGTVTVNWTLDTDAYGGSAVTGYDVYESTTPGFTPTAADLVAGSPTTTATAVGLVVNGLTNGVTYSFVVEAVSAAGNSAPSNEESATPSAPPPPVPPPPPRGALDVATGTSSSPTGSTATAVSRNPAKRITLQVRATGEGAFTIAQLRAVAKAPPRALLVAALLDVSVASGSTFTRLTARVCGRGVGTAISWSNAATGRWKPLHAASGPTRTKARPPCVSFSLSPASSPATTHLGATAFAVGRPRHR